MEEDLERYTQEDSVQNSEELMNDSDVEELSSDSPQRKEMKRQILSCRNVLALHPPGHPDRALSLFNLAEALNEIDSERSIPFYQEALALRPPGHPDHFSSVSRLAYALELGDSMEDLEAAIAMHRRAIALRPQDEPEVRAFSLDNLADRLRGQYENTKEMEYLDRAISLHHETLMIVPLGHPACPFTVDSILHRLKTRYDQSKKMEDLESIISFCREALQFDLNNKYRPKRLDSLADALKTRYEESQNMEDLESVVTLYREALDLCPSGHRDHVQSVINLAHALKVRDQISLPEALSLCPTHHDNRCEFLTNLASGLMDRYDDLEQMDDLENAISVNREALALSLAGDLDHLRACAGLCTGLIARHKRLDLQEDLQEAFICYEKVTSHKYGILDLKRRLDMALEWIENAREFEHGSLLCAYRAAVHLLNRSLILHTRVEEQSSFITSYESDMPSSLACEAASVAIEAGELELAVELLEEGRSMVWSKINAYNNPLNQLRQAQGGGDLADRLEALNAELLTLSASEKPPQPNPIQSMNSSSSSLNYDLDDQNMRYSVLSKEWEVLIEKIREIDGFGNFLRPPSFSTLQAAAAEGPVIIINVSQYRSDVLILCRENPPLLVNLPDVRQDDLYQQAEKHIDEIVSVLRYMWFKIVQSIARCLSILGFPKHSRIWWCPTGISRFLPFHVAGPYSNGLNMSDMFTSSYTPTLSSLIRARSNQVPSVATPKILVVGGPVNGSEETLPNVGDQEGKIIQQYDASVKVDVLSGAEATREAVLEGLKEHSWVHFSCDSELGDDIGQPFRTSFELHDGYLNLLDLIRTRVPHAEFAFISENASGSSQMPDENINLASALQFAGFRSIVGTYNWGMLEDDTQVVLENFYQYMFRNPGQLDYRDSAQALRETVKAMRKAGLAAQHWAIFIHIGA